MFALYLITAAHPPETIVRTLERALSAVPREQVCVQLRAKHISTREQHALAQRVRALCSERAVPLVINDRVDIALSVGADGVHLPEAGLPLSAARQLLGDAALIGVSCHDAAGLARAAQCGASFATLSPVFTSPGKGEPLGVARFAQLAQTAQLPLYALGGIRPEHALQLRAAGARGIAAISAIADAAEPGASMQQFLAAFA